MGLINAERIFMKFKMGVGWRGGCYEIVNFLLILLEVRDVNGR